MENSIAHKALKQVAQMHNVSVDEVMHQIEEAYALGKSDDSTMPIVSAAEIIDRVSRMVIERLSL